MKITVFSPVPVDQCICPLKLRLDKNKKVIKAYDKGYAIQYRIFNHFINPKS